MARKMNSLLVRSVFGVGGVIGLLGQAHASVIGPTVTTTPIASTQTEWNGNLSFPQFNQTLGSLTDVSLQYHTGISTTLTVKDLTGNGSSGQAFTEVAISIADGGGMLTADEPQLDVDSSHYPFSLSGNQTLTSGLLGGNQTSGIFDYTAPTLLAEFTGPGSVTLSATTLTTPQVNYSFGNISNLQVTDASLTAFVTYTYTPAVPEPATLSLLVLGGVPLLSRRRRRVD